MNMAISNLPVKMVLYACMASFSMFGSATAKADLLISGDINDADTTYTFRDFSGAETFNGLGDTWNAIDVANNTTPTFSNLVDSTGAPTTIDFNFTSQVSTWRGNDPGTVDNRELVRDYISTAAFTFTITGLDPTATVDFYAFGTSQFSGSYNLTIGGEQEAVSFISGTGGLPANAGGSQSWTGLTPDETGTLSGSVSGSGFSGFHIVVVPEPGTALLLVGGLTCIALIRRRNGR